MSNGEEPDEEDEVRDEEDDEGATKGVKRRKKSEANEIAEVDSVWWKQTWKDLAYSKTDFIENCIGRQDAYADANIEFQYTMSQDEPFTTKYPDVKNDWGCMFAHYYNLHKDVVKRLHSTELEFIEKKPCFFHLKPVTAFGFEENVLKDLDYQVTCIDYDKRNRLHIKRIMFLCKVGRVIELDSYLEEFYNDINELIKAENRLIYTQYSEHLIRQIYVATGGNADPDAEFLEPVLITMLRFAPLLLEALTSSDPILQFASYLNASIHTELSAYNEYMRVFEPLMSIATGSTEIWLERDDDIPMTDRVKKNSVVPIMPLISEAESTGNYTDYRGRVFVYFDTKALTLFKTDPPIFQRLKETVKHLWGLCYALIHDTSNREAYPMLTPLVVNAAYRSLMEVMRLVKDLMHCNAIYPEDESARQDTPVLGNRGVCLGRVLSDTQWDKIYARVPPFSTPDIYFLLSGYPLIPDKTGLESCIFGPWFMVPSRPEAKRVKASKGTKRPSPDEGEDINAIAQSEDDDSNPASKVSKTELKVDLFGAPANPTDAKRKIATLFKKFDRDYIPKILESDKILKNDEEFTKNCTAWKETFRKQLDIVLPEAIAQLVKKNEDVSAEDFEDATQLIQQKADSSRFLRLRHHIRYVLSYDPDEARDEDASAPKMMKVVYKNILEIPETDLSDRQTLYDTFYAELTRIIKKCDVAEQAVVEKLNAAVTVIDFIRSHAVSDELIEVRKSYPEFTGERETSTFELARRTFVKNVMMEDSLWSLKWLKVDRQHFAEAFLSLPAYHMPSEALHHTYTDLKLANVDIGKVNDEMLLKVKGGYFKDDEERIAKVIDKELSDRRKEQKKSATPWGLTFKEPDPLNLAEFKEIVSKNTVSSIIDANVMASIGSIVNYAMYIDEYPDEAPSYLVYMTMTQPTQNVYINNIVTSIIQSPANALLPPPARPASLDLGPNSAESNEADAIVNETDLIIEDAEFVQDYPLISTKENPIDIYEWIPEEFFGNQQARFETHEAAFSVFWDITVRGDDSLVSYVARTQLKAMALRKFDFRGKDSSFMTAWFSRYFVMKQRFNALFNIVMTTNQFPFDFFGMYREIFYRVYKLFFTYQIEKQRAPIDSECSIAEQANLKAIGVFGMFKAQNILNLYNFEATATNMLETVNKLANVTGLIEDAEKRTREGEKILSRTSKKYLYHTGDSDISLGQLKHILKESIYCLEAFHFIQRMDSLRKRFKDTRRFAQAFPYCSMLLACIENTFSITSNIEYPLSASEDSETYLRLLGVNLDYKAPLKDFIAERLKAEASSEDLNIIDLDRYTDERGSNSQFVVFKEPSDDPMDFNIEYYNEANPEPPLPPEAEEKQSEE